jgi:hypothetical protein
VLDPRLADTDGDGTDDGDEDLDGDGVTNADEIDDGTDAVDPDTDHDVLDDGEEAAAGTDPHDTDSDDDGVSDFFDVAFGSGLLADLDAASFESSIASGYTFVEMYASWCPFSQPAVGELYAGARAVGPGHPVRLGVHLTSDESRGLSIPGADHGVRAFPTAILFGPGGVELGRLVGHLPGSMEQLVQDLAVVAGDGTITAEELQNVAPPNFTVTPAP